VRSHMDANNVDRDSEAFFTSLPSRHTC